MLDGSGMTDCAFSDDEDCMGSGGGEASEETDPTKTDHVISRLKSYALIK